MCLNHQMVVKTEKIFNTSKRKPAKKASSHDWHSVRMGVVTAGPPKSGRNFSGLNERRSGPP